MRRISIALALVGVLIATIAPSGARAAVTIGETGVPNQTCGLNDNLVQVSTAVPGYAVPAGFGVVTSWSFRGQGTGKMLVMRFALPPDQYSVVGKTATQTFNPDTPVTYPTRIPVQPGDVLGMRFVAVGGVCRLNTGTPGDLIRFGPSADDPPDGSTVMLTFLLPQSRLLVAATIEPDCDADGFGDETQDSVVECAPPAGTGTGAGTGTCKGRTATITGTEGNDSLAGTPRRDVISGLGGKDKIRGLAGNDLICGDGGRDTLKGGKGKDKLLGLSGRDALKGGSGNDSCKGGKGRDKEKSC